MCDGSNDVQTEINGRAWDESVGASAKETTSEQNACEEQRDNSWNAHAPVRVPRDARGEDQLVREERPEEVEDEEEVGPRPRYEAVEFGRAAARIRRGERRERREGRRGRRGLLQGISFGR